MTRFINSSVLLMLLLILLFSGGCRRDPYKVSLTGIEVNLQMKDLGSAIFETPPNEMAARAEELRLEYGHAMEIYSHLLSLGEPGDELWKSDFILFATDLRNLDLWDEVKRVWPDTDRLRSELELAFRHYHYYFPEKPLPEVVTCITTFNNSIIIDDSLLMISLDRYLGADCRYYPSLGIYDYQARKMTPAYTVSDCMYAWAATEWDFNSMAYDSRTLLVSMLHEARLLYFTKRMIPAIADTLLHGFTSRQLEFCKANEEQIWEYLVSRDLLFSTDGFMIRKFTGEAPFTSYFTADSPGRAVVWTGFRIIERYMRNHPEVSLKELMAITDCQVILAGARYNPQ